MNRYLPLLLAALALLSVPALAGEDDAGLNNASLVVEYGLDSLERRYYRPVFHFDFPGRRNNLFAEVQYHSRMNGRLQGAIDYWVMAGAQKALNEKVTVELRLNHFCRHETLRDTPYVWNLNEVLGRVILDRGDLTLALGAGVFVGGSAGYRELVTASGEWRGLFIPELSLQAEVKLVNFSRLYHDGGFALALNRNVDLFFRNTRHYEFRNASYLGLRFKSHGESGAFLDAMKVLVGASPFDDRFKLEIEGDFKLEFFRNDSRRVVLGVEFESPILNGDGFFAQFWPGKMIYDLGLDYEKRVAPELFAAWVARYRADIPVDDDLPFAASLFTGLALRNQEEFDVLESDVRYEAAVGYDFKRGLAFSGKLGLGIWDCAALKVFTEMRAHADPRRIRFDIRLLAGSRGRVELRPYLGWKKEIGLDPAQETPGKFLFGLGFFKKF
ncbi:MAG: hypothetical protein MUC72_03600 [Acidobacteria bacterium]|nr:hypothetical protein [Acidobacteriota bacterium]